MDGTLEKPKFPEGDAARSIIGIKPYTPPQDIVMQMLKKETSALLAQARNTSQERHIKSGLNPDIKVSVAIGSTGGGRTFVSSYCAAALYELGIVDAVYAVRPAVTAGENLGYLPGTEKEKVDPFFEPIYDSFAQLNLKRKISIQALTVGYARGRTIRNAAIIFDECQNVTPHQMKLVMGRIGEGSFMFANGDINQIDLPMRRQPDGKWVQEKSGLISYLNGIKSLHKVQDLTHEDSYLHGKQELVVYDPDHCERSEAAAYMMNFFRTHCRD